MFISYARTDVEAVQPIDAALKREGLRVSHDEDEIETFEAITEGVRKDLEKSRVLFCYYSARSATGRACQSELTAAFLAASTDQRPGARIRVINPERTRDRLFFGRPHGAGSTARCCFRRSSSARRRRGLARVGRSDRR